MEKNGESDHFLEILENLVVPNLWGKNLQGLKSWGCEVQRHCRAMLRICAMLDVQHRADHETPLFLSIWISPLPVWVFADLLYVHADTPLDSPARTRAHVRTPLE